jgi:hypothetical protein
MYDDDLEARILKFEQAWQIHGQCEIEGFLDEPNRVPAEARLRLLIELICIDLEFRWRNFASGGRASNQAVLVEYVGRFPELGDIDRLPVELIGQEYRVRRQWGDRPGHDEFLARFESRRDCIQAELQQVDAEIAHESDDWGTNAPATQRLEARDPSVGPIVDVPLLSHRDVLLRKMVGSGMMGKVYEAWQFSASRPVAVKFLRKAFLHHPGLVQRFIGEATTVAKLSHPNVVGVYGLGRTPAKAYFIVMELIAGPNLAVRSRQGPIPVGRAIRWAIDTCYAVGHAHSNGIIHCDLKPANLLLAKDGTIRVTDFGFARTLSERNCLVGDLEGTAPFIAPEQASRCWGEIDIRTDVYGIGAVLFALLTGRPPWIGRRLPDILAQVTSRAAVVSPQRLRADIPEHLDAICRKCLSKAPHDRYKTVEELCSDLSRLIG